MRTPTNARGLDRRALRAAIVAAYGSLDAQRLIGSLLSRGISAAVHSYLDGTSQPSVPTLRAIAEILGTTMDALCGRGEQS